MANYGPEDTQLVLVIGAAMYDAEAWIKRHLPRSSEITYWARSIMVPRSLEGARFNRAIFTPRAQDMVRKAKLITDTQVELIQGNLRMGGAAEIEWPDGL